LAKKKWFAKLATIFSKSDTTNHRNARTTTRSPTRTVNRTTTRSTSRTPTRTVNRTTTRTTTRSPTRNVNHTTSRSTYRTTVHSNSRPMNRTRTSTTQRTYSQTSKTVHRSYTSGNSTVTKRTYSLRQIRPMGTILNKEDFKCIFCFQLPKLPEDEKRGIIICPHCRHPAHADEFRVWLKSSRLCSRCDRPISTNFLRTVEIIPTTVYIKAMKIIMKKGRK